MSMICASSPHYLGPNNFICTTFWAMSVPIISHHLSKQRIHLSFWNYMHTGEINWRKYWFMLSQFLWYKEKIWLKFQIIWVCICDVSMIIFHLSVFGFFVSSLSIPLLCSFNIFQIKSSTLCLAPFYPIIWGYFSELLWIKQKYWYIHKFVLKEEQLKTNSPELPTPSAWWFRHL